MRVRIRVPYVHTNNITFVEKKEKKKRVGKKMGEKNERDTQDRILHPFCIRAVQGSAVQPENLFDGGVYITTSINNAIILINQMRVHLCTRMYLLRNVTWK